MSVFYFSFVGNCEIDLEIKRYFCRAGVKSIQVKFRPFFFSNVELNPHPANVHGMLSFVKGPRSLTFCFI